MAAAPLDRKLYLTGVLQAIARKPTPVELPRAKRSVPVLTMLRREQPWADAEPERFSAVPNKPALHFEGRPTWAEFIVLRLLERDAWKGAWVKNWGGRAFWRDVLEDCDLPSSALTRFRQIEKRAGGQGGGCWDIFVSRGDEFLFIESKQSEGRDQVRETQEIWLESALDEGIPLESFAIVEWVQYGYGHLPR
jgi:hypothetical protein